MKPPMAKNVDKRNYCIIPIEAVQDKRLHGTSAFSVLALICTYTDFLGVTWVSQGRIANELGVSRPAVARQVKKLKDMGYLVEEKRLNKWQVTKSLKVVFKNAPEDTDEAKANLNAEQQINVEETRRKARDEFKAKATRTDQHPNNDIDQPVDKSEVGVTSEVTGGVTPLGYTNEPYNDKVKSINSDEARQFCVMFLRSAESFGTPRVLNDRDLDVMGRWISNGLTKDQWAKILQDHWDWSRSKHRDFARGIGYFANPVERATTGKRPAPKMDAKSVLKRAVRSTRG